MNDSAIRRVLTAYFLIAAVLVVVAVVAVRNIARTAAAADWVNHTHAVIQETGEILSTARAGEGSLRAYATNGDAVDRTASREAFDELSEHVEIAKALTRSDPAQHAQILRLETLAADRAKLLDAVLAARKSGHADEMTALLNRQDWRETGEIKRIVAKFRTEQMALLADRDKAAYLQAQATRWTVCSGVVLNFLLLGGSGWLIRDDLAARRRAAVVLQQANEQLETRVQARTAELAAANDKLSTENLERRWANEALEHQIHYNQIVVNSIGDAVFILTKSLNISRINPAVVRLTGLDSKDLVNRPLRNVVRPSGTPAETTALFDPLQLALKEGHDLRDIPGEAEDKFGAKKPVRFTLFPLRDRDKVVGGVVIVQTNQAALTTA